MAYFGGAVVWMTLIVQWSCLLKPGEAAARKNVLFIVSDDLRPAMSSYQGHDVISPEMHTPNLDQLAASSLLMTRAYVQYAVCGPSRASFLTGRRPDTTHVYNLVDNFRDVGGDYTTIPQYFKQQGYHSVGMGKVFHPGSASDDNDPISWSEPYIVLSRTTWEKDAPASWMAVPARMRRQNPLQDDVIASSAVHVLRRLSKNVEEQPFFLAVGFHKPHLPFIFPEEFMEFYPENKIRVPDNQFAPVGMPKEAWTSFGELRAFDDIGPLTTGEINTTLPADVVRSLRRAYYSCVSYVDSLVGDLLGELTALGLSDNTVVSFIGDHGWQLGEHGEWAKHTNFELSTHTPMMVRVPGLTDGGVVTEQITEMVDLFPTLVDAAGLPELPLCPREGATEVSLCREGSSLMPLVHHPGKRFKERAFSQYRRSTTMGYTMRTDDYRYTEWMDQDIESHTSDWSSVKATELYDHATDPEENYNRAEDASYREVRRQLHRELRAGWRQVLPEE